MTSLCATREGNHKIPFLLDTMEFSALLNLRVSLSLSLFFFFFPALPVSILKIIVPSMGCRSISTSIRLRGKQIVLEEFLKKKKRKNKRKKKRVSVFGPGT